VLGASGPTTVTNLRLPPAMRIAVLAPHPDDFDAIGVTLRWFQSRGHRLDVGVLTTGASGVEDVYRGAVAADVKRDIREAEQRTSCRFFGLPDNQVTFLRLLEDDTGHLAPCPANLERLRSFFEALAPQITFLPHGNDSNPDHQRTAAFFREIARACASPVVACFNRDPKTVAMRTDLFIGFDDNDARWKGELLRCHESQHQRNLNTRGYGFDERILRVNRRIAAELGGTWPYAESFEVECLGGSHSGANVGTSTTHPA